MKPTFSISVPRQASAGAALSLTLLSVLGLVACSNVLKAVEVSFHATSVKVDGTYTLTLGGSQVSVSQTAAECASNFVASTSTNIASLTPGQTYTLRQTFSSPPGSSCRSATPQLSSSSCYSILSTALDPDTWEVKVINDRTNTLQIGICCLPADGVSKTTVSISGPPLPGPYTWSISGGGCTIEGTNDWATITAGTQPGTATVKVQAADCTVEGVLELCPADGSEPPNGPPSGPPEGPPPSAPPSGPPGGPPSGPPSGPPGCNSCGSRAPGGASAGLGDNGINVHVNLGPSHAGGIAGSLAVYARTPSTNLYSQMSLQYNYADNGVVAKRDSENVVQQLLTDTLLATVVSNSSSGYTLAFYGLTNVLGMSSNGLYLTTNSPFAVVRIENPEAGSSTNKLRVIESRDGNSWVFDYEFLSEGWQLTSGNGSRVEKVTRSTNGSVVSVTREIKNNSAQVVWTSTSKYQPLTFGTALVERVIGNVLTNNYTYLSNGFPEKILYADGNWDWFVYDAQNRVTNHFSAWGLNGPSTNRALSRLTEYDYTPVAGTDDDASFSKNSPRKTVEYVADQEVSRRYAIITHGEQRDIVCQTSGAEYDDPGNLVTKTLFNTDLTNRFYGRPIKVIDPRIKLTIYQYAEVNGNEITTISSGIPDFDYDQSTNIWWGTREVVTTDSLGRLLSQTNYVIWRDANHGGGAFTNLTSSQTYSAFDESGEALRIDYSDGTFTHAVHGCCGVASFTNREGSVITYDYDSLRRRNSVVRDGITHLSVFDPVGNLLGSIRYGTDSSVLTNASYTYDTAGRLKTATTALNHTTSFTNYFDGSGYRVARTTLPDGTITNRYYRDGLLFERTGTATYPETHIYGADTSGLAFGGVQYETLQKGMSTESEKIYTDMLGRTVRRVYSVPSGTAPYHAFVYSAVGNLNTQGLLIQEVDPDGVTTSHDYSGSNGTDWMTEWSQRSVADRTLREELIYTADLLGYVNYPVARVLRTIEAGVEVRRATSTFDGLHTLRSESGRETLASIAYAGSGSRYVTNRAPDSSTTISHYRHGKLVSTTQFDSAAAQIGGTTNTYDAHGRLSASTDARNGTTTYAYNNADQVTSITTPAPGPGQSAQVTQHAYDSRGRVWKTTHPDGTSVTNEFYPTGLLKKTYGSRTYPVEYKYDSQGRMTNMTTWQDFASGTGVATTTWKYDAYRGFMTNKLYADGKGTGYSYTNSGKLASRVWARGVTTSYAYNSAGDLHKIMYSDSTPSVTNTYDNRGRVTTVQFGTNTATLKYNDAGQLLSESLNGVTVTNTYDSLLRRVSNGVWVAGSSILNVTNAYDAASRLAVVSDGTHSATYAYLANSPLVDNIVFKQGSTTRMTTTKSYDKLNRLTKIESVAGGSNVSSHAYAYDQANQRTSATNAENARWTYTYDKLGQVTSGKKYWSDGVPVAGQQFEYAYDDIGNRKSAASGGNEWGSGLRYANYSPNNLNQNTSRTVPSYIDVLGAANSNATVTVNDTPTYRKGEYFRGEVPVTNGIGPIWLSLTNLAVLNDGANPDITTNFVGDRYMPQATQTFAYDADWNLTNDGRWVYVWDGENRLVSMTSSNLAAAAGNLKLEFDYDYAWRRIAKHVYNSSGQLIRNHRFTYDGWNLLAELSATNNAVIRKYTWGLDISGNEQLTGGVGGLLAINDALEGAHFAAYDGNGNGSALVKADDSSVSTTYEYSPFGQTIRANGIFAKMNPFRFSTKYTDEESDLLYYGYRYYTAATGEWLNRDPVEEWGGLNLSGFVRCDPVNDVDFLGLEQPPIYTDGPLPNPVIPPTWPMPRPGDPPLPPPLTPPSPPPGTPGFGSPTRPPPPRTPGPPRAPVPPIAIDAIKDLDLKGIINRGLKECASQALPNTTSCCVIVYCYSQGCMNGIEYRSSTAGPASILNQPCDVVEQISLSRLFLVECPNRQKPKAEYIRW